MAERRALIAAVDDTAAVRAMLGAPVTTRELRCSVVVRQWCFHDLNLPSPQAVPPVVRWVSCSGWDSSGHAFAALLPSPSLPFPALGAPTLAPFTLIKVVQRIPRAFGWARATASSQGASFWECSLG